MLTLSSLCTINVQSYGTEKTQGASVQPDVKTAQVRKHNCSQHSPLG